MALWQAISNDIVHLQITSLIITANSLFALKWIGPIIFWKILKYAIMWKFAVKLINLIPNRPSCGYIEKVSLEPEAEVRRYAYGIVSPARWYMHFVWFSMWDGFFSPRVSESRPSRVATRVGFEDEWWEIHLTWKTIQNGFSRILYTLKHFNEAKYNVQSFRSWKPCEMDLSHNCSLHGRMSEVCEKGLSQHKSPKSFTSL